MLDLTKLRNTDHSIIALGSHPGILQSMMDFDYLSGKRVPDLKAIVASGKKYLRLFWGSQEEMIPVYGTLEDVPENIRNDTSLFLNLTSGRRSMSSTLEILTALPNLMGGTLFAENIPEKNTLGIYNHIKKNQFVVGPASVGLLIPGHLKLGAIGGTQAKQLLGANLFEQGKVAVFSSSGGMTNELINLVTGAGKGISFSLSFGGDRFPLLTPIDAFRAAEKDKNTEAIVYFGELGGYDEYDLVELIKAKKITKKIITYIGGTISEMFETPPQFGHAKAMAARGEETAQAKTAALKAVGVHATSSFTEFIKLVQSLPDTKMNSNNAREKMAKGMSQRKASYFINGISHDKDGSVEIVGKDLLSLATEHSYGYVVGSMLLGRQLKSKNTAEFIDLVMKLLVDHGPYVSGAVNTMISARAGKDLVSSVVSGLLTIGPRFGGAINQAAKHWLEGVDTQVSPYDYVESIAKKRGIISGIGHKKYRVDAPDPRASLILEFTKQIKQTSYTDFAKGVEKITTAKKGNLILNVDGAIAAVLLDLLSEKEGLTVRELQELIDAEFFNAFFVLSRAVGFTAHYLDQKRRDEGLFRLSPNEVGLTK
ncbi:hypothetical protein IPM65_03210 [Candidatus Roizmanbacteria bacterium]|nr:MAG: hypothetical protein IPM65_03210 [Candidatus Roizmanbacteria bacterium]